MYLETGLSTRYSVITEPIDLLRKRVTGKILTTKSPEFDAARKVSNLRSNRFPYAIVQVASADDVAATVSFARELGFPLAVRSGGHSLGLFSVVDDAVVIDFSKMKQVEIDPVTAVAKVQAGATSADIVNAAQPHGLALTTGDTSSVGIGGLTTGGGVGFMLRKYGLTIDSLLSAQVVLADGSVVTASKKEHPSLFWAIRGGGGNFGVVTEFTFQLARVGTVLGGDIMLPATREVIRGYLDYSVEAPEDLTTIAFLMHAPPAPHVPADRVGEVVLEIMAIWTGSPEEGEKALAPLRALATPVADSMHPMPYGDIYQYTAPAAEPHVASVRMMFADELSDLAIDESIAAVAQSTSPFSFVQLRGLGGAMARVSPDATAFANRTQKYFVAVIGLWLDATEDARPHERWTTSLWEKIRGEGDGVYVNFLEKEGDARIHEAYPGDTYERLVAVKTAYDPENLFRFNQNIAPRA
jgi:FAD binding domain-containing protein/berberine-like enzyme